MQSTRRPSLRANHPAHHRLWLSALGVASCAVVSCLPGCATSELHPPPPPTGQTLPIADPAPSRVVVHVTLFAAGLRAQIDAAIANKGDGQVEAIAGQKVNYSWTRDPLSLKFDRGRLVLETTITGRVRLLGERSFPIHLVIAGEPVVAADYQAQLQSLSVDVTAQAPIERVSRLLEQTLKAAVTEKLDAFRLDLRPLVAKAYEQLARPIPFAFSGRTACAELRIAAIEAGPTVLAGGVEKDLAVVVLPSVTLPCSTVAAAKSPVQSPVQSPGKSPVVAPATPASPRLPLLANVASLLAGPFPVDVPIAAEYLELSRAMDSAFGGQLHFSKEYPNLFLEKPEVYPAREQLVIKIILGGTVQIAGMTTSLRGELFFSGHPHVVDNQITVPDLELTPGTADGLLKLKVLLDGKAIRDQAQAALRVDVSERLQRVKDKLSTELTFEEGLGCMRAELLHTEITGIFPHESYLRIYVHVDAQASLYIPCPSNSPSPAMNPAINQSINPAGNPSTSQ